MLAPPCKAFFVIGTLFDTRIKNETHLCAILKQESLLLACWIQTELHLQSLERRSDHFMSLRIHPPAPKDEALCSLLVDQRPDGRYWARTSDPQLVELVLYQLS